MQRAMDDISRKAAIDLAMRFSGIEPPEVHYVDSKISGPQGGYQKARVPDVVMAVEKRSPVIRTGDGWVVGVASLADLFSRKFYVERRFDHAAYRKTTWGLKGTPYVTPSPGIYLWWTFVEYGITTARKAYWAAYSAENAGGTLTLRYPIYYKNKILRPGSAFPIRQKDGKTMFTQHQKVAGKNYFRVVDEAIIRSGGYISQSIGTALRNLGKRM
jgi:hypothetical protein